MKVTWFAAASLAVETTAGRLLIDPFFPLKGSPTRVAPDTYAGYDDILVTHGHFDHIMSLPRILREGRAVVHCTETPRQTLLSMDVPEARVIPFNPGDALKMQGMRVSVFRSRYPAFEMPVLLNRRLPQYAGNAMMLLMGMQNYPENGESVGFLIEDEASSLFVLGSLALDDGTDYPSGMDLLVLPWQGRGDLVTPAMQIIGRLKPKAVLLDHFDDAFPPGSRAVDTAQLQAKLDGVLPLVIPRPGESLTIA